MSSRSYPQVTRLVMQRPWAILEEQFETIVEIVDMRRQGERFTDEEIRERLEAARPPAAQRRAQRQAHAGVAVIPIHGTIVPKASLMSDMSGGVAISDLRAMFQSAMSDPDVGAVVFDVDSPGGSVDLVPEFAAEIRAARGRKPMLACSNTMMASAAYWLASQADEVSVSPSSLTGSIGVFAAHQDTSEAQAQLGVKTTFISAGKYKTEGNSSEPLTPSATEHMQSLVDSAYGMFTSDVAKGRRANVADVRGGYGEGRVLDAKGSVAAGLADRVATLEQTITRAANLTAPVASLAATSPLIDRLVALDAHLEALERGAGPVAPKSTPTTTAAWDGPANEARLKSPLTESDAKAAYAWIDDAQVEDGTLPKSAAKFPHHMVSEGGDVGAANLAACSSGIAVLNGGRGGANIPAGDRKGVWNHLAKHLRDGNHVPPPLTGYIDQTDLEAARGDASFAEQAEALLCMADELLAQGRRLTAAKRDRLRVLGERIDSLVAAKDTATNDFDLEVKVAAMRARARIAATKLRSP
jgi:capsid assembly protease